MAWGWPGVESAAVRRLTDRMGFMTCDTRPVMDCVLPSSPGGGASSGRSACSEDVARPLGRGRGAGRIFPAPAPAFLPGGRSLRSGAGGSAAAGSFTPPRSLLPAAVSTAADGRNFMIDNRPRLAAGAGTAGQVRHLDNDRVADRGCPPQERGMQE